MAPKDEHGLTLIEMLVTTAILIFILSAAYNVIDTSQRVTAHNEETADMDSTGRTAMEIMSAELRSCALNPRGLKPSSLLPASAPWLAVPSGVTVGEGLEVRMDLNGDGDTRDSNEYVRYRWVQTGSTGVGYIERTADRDSDGNDTIETADGPQTLAKNVMKISGESAIFKTLNKSGTTLTTATDIQNSGEAVVVQFAVRTDKKDRVTRKYRQIDLREHVMLANRSYYP